MSEEPKRGMVRHDPHPELVQLTSAENIQRMRVLRDLLWRDVYNDPLALAIANAWWDLNHNEIEEAQQRLGNVFGQDQKPRVQDQQGQQD